MACDGGHRPPGGDSWRGFCTAGARRANTLRWSYAHRVRHLPEADPAGVGVHRAVRRAVVVEGHGHDVVDRDADAAAALVDANGLEQALGRGRDQVPVDRDQRKAEDELGAGESCAR